MSSVYRVITPVYVLGISAAHHQEVEYIYIPPDDGLLICPKYVEV
jgi:hypothetical protein